MQGEGEPATLRLDVEKSTRRLSRARPCFHSQPMAAPYVPLRIFSCYTMLEGAIEDGQSSKLPIGRVLAEAEQPIDIHWAP